jgi:hypothetical protein
MKSTLFETPSLAHPVLLQNAEPGALRLAFWVHKGLRPCVAPWRRVLSCSTSGGAEGASLTVFASTAEASVLDVRTKVPVAGIGLESVLPPGAWSGNLDDIVFSRPYTAAPGMRLDALRLNPEWNSPAYGYLVCVSRGSLPETHGQVAEIDGLSVLVSKTRDVGALMENSWPLEQESFALCIQGMVRYNRGARSVRR